MPPKKRAKKQLTVNDTTGPKGTSRTNANAPAPIGPAKALLKFPAEIISQVLSHFHRITPHTRVADNDREVPLEERYETIGPVLPNRYLEHWDVLRALSQVCVAWRAVFRPMFWESVQVCVTNREGNTGKGFYRFIGEALQRKCEGLLRNPGVGEMVRTVHVCLTRYQTDTILPIFAKCLKRLPNLHTIQILHAHTQMTTAIRLGFEGVSLPRVRTLIGPSNVHEILKSCPEVRTVRCEGGSSTFIGVMPKNCKKVEELRGGFADGYDLAVMKRLVKAAPNLRVFEIHVYRKDQSIHDDVVSLLKKFKNLCTIEIRHHEKSGLDMTNVHVKETIAKLRSVLNDSSSQERKELRARHARVEDTDTGGFQNIGLE